MNNNLIKYELYEELVLSVNNLKFDYSLDVNDFNILSYFLRLGCPILYNEEISFLSIGLDNYPELSSQFNLINETDNLILLENVISLYGSQSKIRYDISKLNRIESLLNNKFGHLSIDDIDIILESILSFYIRNIPIKTVGSYLDFLCNILKKLK